MKKETIKTICGMVLLSALVVGTLAVLSHFNVITWFPKWF